MMAKKDDEFSEEVLTACADFYRSSGHAQGLMKAHDVVAKMCAETFLAGSDETSKGLRKACNALRALAQEADTYAESKRKVYIALKDKD